LPVIERCADKNELYKWLTANDIGVPRSVRGDAWRELVSASGFPIVVKPTLASGGSRNVAILATPHEVERYFADTEQDPQAVVMQEYVGTTETEFTVGVIVSKAGSVIDSIIIHRNLVGLTQGTTRTIDGRKYGLSTGYSQGYVIRDESLRKFCEDLALRIGARGPLNIQCRRQGDAIKVLEVHPRFSGTTSIRADVGFNEPDVLIENFLFDRSFARLSYRDDVAVIRAFQTIVVARSTLTTVPRA
jgi:carbamoyl-phosphate synthase large subunit